MALPRPGELAALGALLCVYRAHPAGELAGWSQAVEARTCCGVDSEGLRERVLFFDRDGRCCWRLCLLPDSDFLVWEEMAARLPAAVEAPPLGRVGGRPWRGLLGRLRGERWLAGILRLHALPAPRHGPADPEVLAASLAPLSALGAATARRIAREEGAEVDTIAATACACEQAARAAACQVPATTIRPAGNASLRLAGYNLGARA